MRMSLPEGTSETSFRKLQNELRILFMHKEVSIDAYSVPSFSVKTSLAGTSSSQFSAPPS